MGAQGSRGLLPASVAALSRRIELWRETRLHRAEAMPAGLWRAAAALAETHGVYRISQALRLSFDGLKARVAVGGKDRLQSRLLGRGAFVEVVGLGDAGGGGGQVELEIESICGSRLRLRVSGGLVGIPAVIEAFCRSSR